MGSMKKKMLMTKPKGFDVKGKEDHLCILKNYL